MSVLSQFTGGTIKRIQRGTITVGNTVTTATITLPFAVDPNKSILTPLGTNTSLIIDSIVAANRTAYLEITGAGTSLTATGASIAGTNVASLTIAWQIVEYN